MEESTQIKSSVSKTSIPPILHKAITFDVYQNILLTAGIADPNEAMLALLVIRLVQGSVSPGGFIQSVSSEFSVSEEIAHSIAKGVVERVLKDIEKDLPFALEELTRDPSQDVSLRLSAKALASAGGGSSSSTDDVKSRGDHVALREAIPFDKPKEIASAVGRPRNDTDKREAVVTDGAKKEDDTKLDEELEDIKQQKVDVLEKKGSFDVSGIVKEICENPAFQFEEAAMRARCAKLIESRVRDVRTPEQTRAQLEKAIDNGGLGMSGRRLADILELLENRVAAYDGAVSQEEQRKRAGQRAAVSEKIELAKKEETLLTKKYIELTGKVPEEHIAPAAPSVSRTSVAISARHEQIAREGKIDATKVKQAIQSAQQTALTPPRSKTLPSMQEVTFEKRLWNPIDELRSLSLTYFRRLSKDPMQAATKVKDRVDLIEEQGYDRKVQAIQAWRESPLNQQYVSLTRDALLAGISVVNLLSRKRTAGEETLSDKELKAVMKLNAELRF